MLQVSEFEAPSPEQFRGEIVPHAKPAVLRGIAADWPVVAAAKAGAEQWIAMLSSRASEQPVEIIRAGPAEEGRFHYTPDGRSLNFVHGRASLPLFLAALQEQAAQPSPYAMAAQGMIAERYVPGFRAVHPMPLVPDEAEPRLWIGNASKVAAHNDPVDNVAVAAAGRRRFTLFPPEAEPDLYMGPAHPTPAGTPVSMVHVTAPDFDRYPRFAAALEVAQEAELSPGDAIFIPKHWFHHVEALERFNMLVNYWWDASPS
jgi:Cupin-like domain